MSYNAASLIKETTTTTGTGDITLDGAATGFVTFASKMTAGSFCYVPYVIRNTAGAYEVGIGRLSAGTTLQRVSVLESSNANALVNFGAGSKDVYCNGGALNPSGPRNNYVGAGAPVNATNNKLQGYGPGSVWVDTWDEEIWMAHSYGAANNTLSWQLVGSIYNRPLLNGSGVRTNSWTLNSIAPLIPSDATNAKVVFINGQYNEVKKEGSSHLYDGSVIIGTYGMSKWYNTIVHAIDHSGQSVAGVHQNMRKIYAARTTNATQTVLSAGNASFSQLRVPLNSIMHVKCSGAAKQNGASEYKTVTYEATLFNNAGTVSIIGTPTWTTVNVSGSASGWLFEAIAASDYINFYVTGVAATTINWTLSMEATLVSDSAA